MRLIDAEVSEMLPIGRAAQRHLADAWSRVVRDGFGAASLGAGFLRRSIMGSWHRSRAAGVAPTLRSAPLALTDDALLAAQQACDWLRPLDAILRAQRDGYVGEDHMLAAFDHEGRMLSADGDPRTLEKLARINFAPGGLWSEAAVGTNGPGTALALAQPVHVVGAEHFCEEWHEWHCASAPVHDPSTGRVIAVIDLSGSRDAAHPYALTMATAIAVALEQKLAAREAQYRSDVLLTYSNLVSRYPSDIVVAVDRVGRVLADSDASGRTTRRLAGMGSEGVTTLAALLGRASASSSTDVVHPMLGGRTASLHPLADDGRVVAGCFVLPSESRRVARAAGSAVRGTVPPTPADVSVRSVHDDPTRWSRIRYTIDDLVGTDQAMHHVRKLARACARTDLPVLLLGESGTGKEVLAQAIHAASPRRDRAFVAVNCAALPRELMESELFGHAAGAFTGARRDGQIGKFQAADGGTLFLDEIAELSAGAQAALLRVLQEGEVTRLGEYAARAFDVRIIAATNRDVQQAVAQGRLRDDLFHRLDVLSMTLPPLRERRGDIAALTQRFLADAPAGEECTLTPDAMQALKQYRWPGNVRELRNVIQRLVTLADTPVLDVHDLPITVRAARDTSALVAFSPPMPAAHNAADEGQAVASGQQDAEQLARRRLSDAIANHATIAEAAASLGITRSTLYRRLQRYGLTSGRAVREAPENARATR